MDYLKTGKVVKEKKAKRIVAMWKKMGFEAWYEPCRGFFITYIKIN